MKTKGIGEGRFRVADQGENIIYDTLEKARSHAEITGSPIWDMDKREYVGEVV